MQGKLKPLPRKEIIQILLKNGFEQVKSKGPHMKFKKNVNGITYTTMVSHCTPIQIPIIRCIIKQTGIPEEEFY